MRINIFGDFKADDIGSVHFSETLLSKLASADINVINFEAPIKASDSRPIQKSGPNISNERIAPRLLHDIGFNVASLANNHCMDYGPASLAETMAMLKKNNIRSLGAGTWSEAYSVCRMEVNDETVGFVGGVQHEFGVLDDEAYGKSSGAAWLMHPCIDELIMQARHDCDYVVVLPHAGLENHDYPIPELRTLYRHYIRLGADAVVASHPHCPQCWEVFMGKPIYYSLGNFIFDAEWKTPYIWDYGLMATLTLEDGKVTASPVVSHYDRSRRLVQIYDGADCPIKEHLREINKTFHNEEKYRAQIRKTNKEMENHYNDMFALSGYFSYFPFLLFKVGLKGIIRKLLGKPRLTFNKSHALNNLQNEVHRWTICHRMEEYLK